MDSDWLVHIELYVN